MPIVKKIIFNGIPIDIDSIGNSVINADTVSDISSQKFSSKIIAPSANSLKILKQYVDSAVIPTKALIFDTIPTKDSLNPVTSGGIYEFIQNAISDYFHEHLIPLTQEEYDAIENPDADKYYFIVESEENLE